MEAPPQKPLPAADLDFILDGTSSLWDEMRGQHIFITGGTGFIGAWLLASFLHANHVLQLNAHATILTRNPHAFAQRCPHLAMATGITLLEGDVRSFSHPSGDFAYVIHAATEVATITAAGDPLERLNAIHDGTAHVLRFAATHGARKFLLTSSGAMYGRQPADLTHIHEDYAGAPDPLDPASAYGEGKRSSELMCALYAKQSSIEFKIARCFAFAGPCLPLDANFAIGNFIGNVLAGRPITILGDGSAMRSYLYAADLAVWLWNMLFRAPHLQAFNVGSEDAISIGDLARTVAATLDPTTAVSIAGKPLPGAPPARYVPSTQKAQRLLGLRQSVGLADAIRRMAAWHGFQEHR